MLAATVTGLGLAGSGSVQAARSVVDTISAGTAGRYAVVTSGNNFVVLSSGSSQNLAVIDTRSFSRVAATLTLGSATAAVQSLGTGADEVLIGTDDGYVQTLLVSDLEAMADGGDTAPFDLVFKPEMGSFDALSAVEINPAGTVLYVANAPDETLSAFTLQASGADPVLISTIALFHRANGAELVSFGGSNRIFFGSDDGTVPWVEADNLTRFELVIDLTLTHDMVGLTQSAFGGGPRILIADQDADMLYVVETSGPSVVAQIGLLGNPVDIATSGAGDQTIIWVAEDGINRVESFTVSLAQSQPPIVLDAAPVSLNEGGGWLYAALADGNVAVITDRPWVEILSVSPSLVGSSSGDVTVTYTTDQAGTASVKLDGFVLETQAATVGSSNAIVLDGAELGPRLEQGRNRLRLEVAATAGGLVGHDEAVITFDDPPGVPRNFGVGFGDERVIARWDAPGDSDLKNYQVFFGTDPAGTSGVAGRTSPQTTTSANYTVDVPNGTLVYMSVRAVDSAGNVSASTPVLGATAQPTLGAADAAGDDGGFLCTAGGRRAARAGDSMLFLAAALFGLAVLARRHP